MFLVCKSMFFISFLQFHRPPHLCPVMSHSLMLSCSSAYLVWTLGSEPGSLLPLWSCCLQRVTHNNHHFLQYFLGRQKKQVWEKCSHKISLSFITSVRAGSSWEARRYLIILQHLTMVKILRCTWRALWWASVLVTSITQSHLLIKCTKTQS